jgi:hypothetical protein
LLFEAEPSGKLSELERPGAGGLVRCSLMMSVAVRVIQIRRLGKFLPKTLDEHTHTLYIYIQYIYIYYIYMEVSWNRGTPKSFVLFSACPWNKASIFMGYPVAIFCALFHLTS